MKKMIALILTLVMCCTLMTGCVGEIATVKIEPNGSGTIDMQFGFTDEAIETMVALGTDPKEIEHYKPFVYNGVTYYGETISQKFANVSEFNTLMNGNMGLETQDVVENMGAFNLFKNEHGAFTFVLNLSNPENSIGVDTTEYTEEEIAILTENMQIIFTLVFPANVTQFAGDKNGVTINGNTLKLDFLKLSENETIEYVFVTGDASTIVFKDVSENHWANRAIYSLAYGGLVAGVGDNNFSPDTPLTRAQFYQILARATGLKVGEAHDYWAYTAIESCKNFGFILKSVDLENFNPAEFDKPITREEAVAALTIATDYGENIIKDYIPMDFTMIPDFNDIDEDYLTQVTLGYIYGITSGVDSNRTFNPKGNLTRAQGCQLFYNLNWCSIPR